MPPTNRLLLVLLDAWRHDEVAATPFLSRLVAGSGGKARLAEPLGFETGPAITAGLWPEESGVAYQFARDPAASPFRFLSRWPKSLFLDRRGRRRLRGWALRQAVRVAEADGFVGAGDPLYTLAMNAPPAAWPQ